MPASTRTMKPISELNVTMTYGKTFGRICRNMIRIGLAPIVLAAST